MTLRHRFWIAGIGLLWAFGVGAGMVGQEMPRSIQGISPPPAQPSEDSWKFVADLRRPLWTNHAWIPREAAAGEADLRGGVCVDAQFDDSESLLDTAYADLAAFLEAGKVPRKGPFVIETRRGETSTFEAYRIEVTSERCRILAADTEGIRRGIFCVEDMMLRSGGPFLPLGTVERRPFIKTRISRCFFGPINRPPKNRDELMDDVDYYPDPYLNRLSHEGVNGLWLSVLFKDLCKTSVLPEAGRNAERRLAKLRKTVAKCRRHGIRIYLFTNEPEAWEVDNPVRKRHPELLGGTLAWWQGNLFCPWSDTAQKYLYQATHGIFSAVPHLGGMINITHGEGLTTCLSSVLCTDNARPTCPLCATRRPWEIIRRTLTPMARGMHDANPEAELIAWFYMPDVHAELADWVYELPDHFSTNVTLQFNFESGVVKEVLGKTRKGGDYWLSTPGPSPRFERIARQSHTAGVSVSAKIQTGCSHEVATVPLVPVPGNLYRKFRAMRELGVSRVMLCWYFGNYPGLMNKAAGELSFEPFPESEDDFLRRLASLEWGKHSEAVVSAWKCFAEGYGHFPLTNHFQYWGPMHDGVVWPLLLRPRDAPLAPTWQIASESTRQPNAPSGDRIGECLGDSYTLAEALAECRSMSDRWNRGVGILRAVEADSAVSAELRRDIGVARALGIQFRSGLNILQFYDLRERMAREEPATQMQSLKEMRQIVDEELRNGSELIRLCSRDSRLGFHSEAEGYKYFPELIRWRMDRMKELLDVEIPALSKEIERGVDVFAEYSGRAIVGPRVQSHYWADIAECVKQAPGNVPSHLSWQTLPDPVRGDIRWTLCHDRKALYLLFDCRNGASISEATLTIEPRRLWPCLNFSEAPSPWPPRKTAPDAKTEKTGWQGWTRIPFDAFGMEATNPRPLRINLRVAGQTDRAWIPRHPWPSRLLLGDDNPSDLGWLAFEKPRGL